MKTSLRALVYRHLLLDSKFIILGISSILFLGMPYFKISTIVYHEFKTTQHFQNLMRNFKTTTGIIKKIYQVKSYLPGRSSYTIEFSYLERQAKINTLDRNYLTTNKIGDQVLVLYNQDTAVIEHIAPYVLAKNTLGIILLTTSIFLLLPMLWCIALCAKSLLAIKRMYNLHVKGVRLPAEIVYFKALRHNNYVAEYLYMPVNGKIKLRAKNKATNYLQSGEKKIGDLINILYDINNPKLTCIDEVNYE